jgi:uncharacterized membrane protein YccC
MATPWSAMRSLARRGTDVAAGRFRERGRSAVGLTVRLAAAAVASYAVALGIFPGTEPLLAPLTALLVVQLTPVSLLTSGVQRVLSVVCGVLVAVGFTFLVGLTWWSLGILIAVSLLIGQALRLGPQIPEVPISAMLVLGVGAGSAGAAAWQRAAETLVGAIVGVLSNLLFPPRVAQEDAGTAIEGLASDLADLLDTAAGELAAGEPAGLAEPASRWLDVARRLTHGVPAVGTALLRAEEGRRLNLRALGRPDAGPGLRQGLEAVEHSSIVIRILFRSLLDAARDEEAAGRRLGLDVLTAVALLLNDLAAGMRSFGRLVRAEADPEELTPDPGQLQEALAGMHDARARVSDLLLIDPRDDPVLTELNYSLLSTVERLLRELDLDERIRYQARVRPVPDPAAHRRGRLSLRSRR